MLQNSNGKLAPVALTLKAAHEYTGLGVWRLRKAIRDKELMSMKPFVVRLILKGELDRLLGIAPPE